MQQLLKHLPGFQGHLGPLGLVWPRQELQSLQAQQSHWEASQQAASHLLLVGRPAGWAVGLVLLLLPRRLQQVVWQQERQAAAGLLQLLQV